MARPQRTQPTRTRDVFAERHARFRSRLSPSFKRVAEYIEANRIEVLTSSALDLARAIGTSDATVVRAVQALGFSGLQDLRAELAASYSGRNAPVDNLTRTWADIGESVETAIDEVVVSLTESLDALREGPARAMMPQILNTLHHAGRIAVFGVGPTAHIAAYFAARARRKGRRVFLLDQMGIALADQLLGLERGDVVLMLAYGMSYREAEATLYEARRQQIPVILVTDAPEEKPARLASAVLEIPRGRSGRIALHGTTVACLEMLLLGLATADQDRASRTLGELERLRETTRPVRRGTRKSFDEDEEK